MKPDLSDRPSRVHCKARNIVTWGGAMLVGAGITVGGYIT
jgi:hypothetical protein